MKTIEQIKEEIDQERIKELKFKQIFEQCYTWIEALKEYMIENVGEQERSLLSNRIESVLKKLQQIANHEAGFLSGNYRDLKRRYSKPAKGIEHIQDLLVEVDNLLGKLRKEVIEFENKVSETLIDHIENHANKIKSLLDQAITQTTVVEDELRDAI
jgi:uncharacterized phage infection (PIP) family protein YhgE